MWCLGKDTSEIRHPCRYHITTILGLYYCSTTTLRLFSPAGMCGGSGRTPHLSASRAADGHRRSPFEASRLQRRRRWRRPEGATGEPGVQRRKCDVRESVGGWVEWRRVWVVGTEAATPGRMTIALTNFKNLFHRLISLTSRNVHLCRQLRLQAARKDYQTQPWQGYYYTL